MAFRMRRQGRAQQAPGKNAPQVEHKVYGPVQQMVYEGPTNANGPLRLDECKHASKPVQKVEVAVPDVAMVPVVPAVAEVPATPNTN